MTTNEMRLSSFFLSKTHSQGGNKLSWVYDSFWSIWAKM